jgi:hypothetical protein
VHVKGCELLLLAANQPRSGLPTYSFSMTRGEGVVVHMAHVHTLQ